MTRLTLALQGRLDRAIEADIRAGQGAITGIIRRKTRQLKKRLRKDVERAGLGKRLAKTIGSTEPPARHKSWTAYGIVFSRAKVKGGGKRASKTDLITVFDEGAVIGPRRGRYLAIPTDVVGRAPTRGRPRLTPSDFPDGSLVPLKNPPRLALRTDPTIVAFWLVRQVRIRPRLNVQSTFQSVTANTDDLIVRKWERDSRRAFQRIR